MKRFAVILMGAVLAGATGCNDSSEPEDASEGQPPATFLMARKPNADLLEDQKAISRKYAKMQSSPVEAPTTASAPATGPKPPTGPESKPEEPTGPKAPPKTATGPEAKPATRPKPKTPNIFTAISKIITPEGDKLKPGKSAPKATANSAPLITHKLPASFKSGLPNNQAYALLAANMTGPLTVWTENAARTKAEKTTHTMQKTDIAALKTAILGAKENLTLAAGGSVWVCFESVAIPKTAKSAALLAALKKMGIRLPAKIMISVNPRKGAILVYRCPRPFKYFKLP